MTAATPPTTTTLTAAPPTDLVVVTGPSFLLPSAEPGGVGSAGPQGSAPTRPTDGRKVKKGRQFTGSALGQTRRQLLITCSCLLQVTASGSFASRSGSLIEIILWLRPSISIRMS